MKTTYASGENPEPVPCPWCKSSKVMVEGNGEGTYAAAVCQKCLARGPEIHIVSLQTDDIRKYAIHAWNKRRGGKFSKVKCPDCGKLVCVTHTGLWSHSRWNGTKLVSCPGSNKTLADIPNELIPISKLPLVRGAGKT